jgi:hypothetical protein
MINVLDVVTMSSGNDWEMRKYWNGKPGKKLPYGFDTVDIDTRSTAADNAQQQLAVYRSNSSIALAWGLKLTDLTEPWGRKYPDQNDASIHLLDVFSNGTLILRTRYAAVDCARAYLPLPGAKMTSVPIQYFKLIKLLNYIENIETARCYFDSHFQTSGFSVVDTQWP